MLVNNSCVTRFFSFFTLLIFFEISVGNNAVSTDLHSFDEYGLRFDVEENFLDDKSNGFQLESSQIRNAQSLSRLGLVLATATLYLTSVGTAVVEFDLRKIVDTHWHRGLSYFKIDWRWIQHALSHSDWLLPFFWLGPGDDPFPVFTSKRHAACHFFQTPSGDLLDLSVNQHS